KELVGGKQRNGTTQFRAKRNKGGYFTVLRTGGTGLGMNLSHGGHLTHGSPVNFSGVLYNFEEYGVDPETELIDYDALLEQAKEVKPKMIVAGASAYSRTIDFKKFREIADEVDAYYFDEWAHIADLVDYGFQPNVVPN